MKGKAVITLLSYDDEDGQVDINVEFDPPIKNEEINPVSHTLALDMLDCAVNGSDDPENAFSRAKIT